MHKIKDFFRKIPKNVYKCLFWVFLIITAIGSGLSSLLEKVEILDISGIYNSLLAIVPSIVTIAETYIIVFIGLTLFCLVMWLYRPRLFLLQHVSFSPEIADVDATLLNEYYVKRVIINECDLMGQTINSNIIRAIDFQDREIDHVKMKINNSNLCYYGIAHTPLVFRLGFKMGDQCNLNFLHKQRSNESLFQEWTTEQSYITIQSSEFNKSVNAEELIVSVSTSLKIIREHLSSLRSNDKHILMFETNSLSFDNITSYTIAENYRNYIMIGIRNCVEKYHIKKIHLVISSSVAFTFFLGQAFSPQHDPMTIVYHYQNNEYRWGICMNELPENALILNNT